MRFLFSDTIGKHTTKCKVRRINLKYENSKVVKFTTIWVMIVKDNNQMHVHNPMKVKGKHDCVLVYVPQRKESMCVFMKRKLMDKFYSAIWV